MDKFYTATKSRSQGRGAWAVIFRHPVRPDVNGKPGRRVRRGLGTADEVRADRLVAELNVLLRSPQWWEPAARDQLTGRFDELILDAFFDGMDPTGHDPLAVRERAIVLPSHSEGFRSVLMLGTTGAGKTTVVRQILGTDPATERFPSTSTAKTTVADTELILSDGPGYQVCVTFVTRDEVLDYIGECVTEAALAALRGSDDLQISRRLLDHPNQRFRFSYILGRPRPPVSLDDDLDDDVDDETDDLVDSAVPAGDGGVDLAATAALVNRSVGTVKRLVFEHAAEVRTSLAESGETDERVIEELVEESLDEELRRDERFHVIVDDLFDEIEKRFELLTTGQVTRNRQHWPVSWTWHSDDRGEFIKTVTRFTSNYAPLFGTLLTPLVSGIRVAGPFTPRWGDGARPRLVIVDGEGLGHTPTSAAALSTSVSRRIEQVDAVVLVDNAAQPMQAAPVAAMKAVVTSGNAKKLMFCFTHFDLVTGANLPTFSDREAHVKASGENVLKALGEDLGPYAERALRERLDHGCFFVGGIDLDLDPGRKAGRRSIGQLRGLLAAIEDVVDVPAPGPARPVFDRTTLVLAVREAAQSFHDAWQGRLGIAYSPDHQKEHWARIKALSRRLAEGFADEYDTLKPVSELKRELDEQIYRMLQHPLEWRGTPPSEDDKQQIIDTLANAISREITELASRRIKTERHEAWRTAYGQSGKGSTYVRAHIISADVYDKAAPVPTVTASLDQNTFLHDVTSAVERVAADHEITLR